MYQQNLKKWTQKRGKICWQRFWPCLMRLLGKLARRFDANYTNHCTRLLSRILTANWCLAPTKASVCFLECEMTFPLLSVSSQRRKKRHFCQHIMLIYTKSTFPFACRMKLLYTIGTAIHCFPQKRLSQAAVVLTFSLSSLIQMESFLFCSC